MLLVMTNEDNDTIKNDDEKWTLCNAQSPHVERWAVKAGSIHETSSEGRGEEITINVLKHFTAPQPLYYTGSSCHPEVSCVMGMLAGKVLFYTNLVRFPKTMWMDEAFFAF